MTWCRRWCCWFRRHPSTDRRLRYDRENPGRLAAARLGRVVVHARRQFPLPLRRGSRTRRHALSRRCPTAPGAGRWPGIGAMAEEAERDAARLRFVALVHHPLALESGLDSGTAAACSRASVGPADRGAKSSRPGDVGIAQGSGFPCDRIAVVLPGTAPAPLAKGTAARIRRVRCPGGTVSVASLTPRKGYDVLFHAFARLPHLEWHLTCAGSRD